MGFFSLGVTAEALRAIIGSKSAILLQRGPVDPKFKAYCKANRMLGLLKRTVKYRNPDTLVRLYKSLVRPHLEYSSPAWSPHYRKDKLLLERVQHRFTLLFDDLKPLEYQERLVKLKLRSLEERRNRADLIELFKWLKASPLFHYRHFSS